MTPSPDPGIAWNVVLTIAVLIAITVNVVALYRGGRTTNRIEPTPLDVRKIPGVMSVDMHRACHEEVVRRLNTHDEDIRAIYRRIEDSQARQEVHASERSAAIYRKIDEVRTEVTDKIDTMPDRIIKTLSDLNLLRRPNGSDRT
jgi:hypothetical protein